MQSFGKRCQTLHLIGNYTILAPALKLFLLCVCACLCMCVCRSVTLSATLGVSPGTLMARGRLLTAKFHRGDFDAGAS